MLGVSAGAEDVDVLLDGLLLLDVLSLLPQAAVAKSSESAEVASATRLMV
jgi:hypothetical protein